MPHAVLVIVAGRKRGLNGAKHGHLARSGLNSIRHELAGHRLTAVIDKKLHSAVQPGLSWSSPQWYRNSADVECASYWAARKHYSGSIVALALIDSPGEWWASSLDLHTEEHRYFADLAVQAGNTSFAFFQRSRGSLHRRICRIGWV